jgi:hypothetical protein
VNKRELIKAELEKLGEEDLQKVYALVMRFKELRQVRQESLIAILREISDNTPLDFARNLDLYLTGERDLPEVEAKE